MLQLTQSPALTVESKFRRTAWLASAVVATLMLIYVGYRIHGILQDYKHPPVEFSIAPDWGKLPNIYVCRRTYLGRRPWVPINHVEAFASEFNDPSGLTQVVPCETRNFSNEQLGYYIGDSCGVCSISEIDMQHWETVGLSIRGSSLPANSVPRLTIIAESVQDAARNVKPWIGVIGAYTAGVNGWPRQMFLLTKEFIGVGNILSVDMYAKFDSVTRGTSDANPDENKDVSTFLVDFEVKTSQAEVIIQKSLGPMLVSEIVSLGGLISLASFLLGLCFVIRVPIEMTLRGYQVAASDAANSLLHESPSRSSQAMRPVPHHPMCQDARQVNVELVSIAV